MITYRILEKTNIATGDKSYTVQCKRLWWWDDVADFNFLLPALDLKKTLQEQRDTKYTTKVIPCTTK